MFINATLLVLTARYLYVSYKLQVFNFVFILCLSKLEADFQLFLESNMDKNIDKLTDAQQTIIPFF